MRRHALGLQTRRHCPARGPPRNLRRRLGGIRRRRRLARSADERRGNDLGRESRRAHDPGLRCVHGRRRPTVAMRAGSQPGDLALREGQAVRRGGVRDASGDCDRRRRDWRRQGELSCHRCRDRTTSIRAAAASSSRSGSTGPTRCCRGYPNRLAARSVGHRSGRRRAAERTPGSSRRTGGSSTSRATHRTRWSPSIRARVRSSGGWRSSVHTSSS